MDKLSRPLRMDLLTAFRFRNNDHRMIEDFVYPVSLHVREKRAVISHEERERLFTGSFSSVKKDSRPWNFFLCIGEIFFKSARLLNVKQIKIVNYPILPIKLVYSLKVWIQVLINCLTYGNIISFIFLLTKHTLL